MDDNLILEHLLVWKFTLDHPLCTNEPRLKQAYRILYIIEEAIRKNYEKEIITKESQDELLKICENLGVAASCRCQKLCGPKCGCKRIGLACGNRCHNGKTFLKCKGEK